MFKVNRVKWIFFNAF